MSTAAACRRRHSEGSSAVGPTESSAARTAAAARSTDRHISLATRAEDHCPISVAVTSDPARFQRLEAAMSQRAPAPTTAPCDRNARSLRRP